MPSTSTTPLVPPGGSRWGTRDFRLLVGGQGLSWLGDAFQPIALSFAIVASGGSATDLGIVLACGVVARLLCTLVGGVWADRLRPQAIMIGADLVRVVAAGALALLYLGTVHPLWLLCVLVGGVRRRRRVLPAGDVVLEANAGPRRTAASQPTPPSQQCRRAR